jgi:hypothetical protein
MKKRHLALVLVILLILAVLGLSWGRPGEIIPGLIGWFFIMLILELPSFWWRMRGGTLLSTWVVGLACPFVILEGLTAYMFRYAGDFMGFESLIMKWVIPAAVLPTGTVMAILAVILARPEGRTESRQSGPGA